MKEMEIFQNLFIPFFTKGANNYCMLLSVSSLCPMCSKGHMDLITTVALLRWSSVGADKT